MTSVVFPPSVNWYCAKVSDVSLGVPKKVAYGAKDSVCLIVVENHDQTVGAHAHRRKLRKKDIRVVARYHHLPDSRVSAVSFSGHETLKHMLVSACTKGFIYVWDTKKQSLQGVGSELIVHAHKHSITAISLSTILPGVVISADNRGFVNVMEQGLYSSKTSSLFEPLKGRGAITSLACSPYVGEHAAVGYRNGTLLILDWTSQLVLHNLNNHTQEVHGLTWLPAQYRDQMNHERQVLRESFGRKSVVGLSTSGIREQSTTTSTDVNSSGTPVRTYTPTELRRIKRSCSQKSKDEGSLEHLPDSMKTLYSETQSVWDKILKEQSFILPPMLASSSRDRSIRIWDCATWVEMDCLKLPRPGGGQAGHKKGNRNKSKCKTSPLGTTSQLYRGGRAATSHQMERLWLTVKWVPYKSDQNPPGSFQAAAHIGLLSSSYLGDLLFWHWNPTTDTFRRTSATPWVCKSKAVHSRPIYNILTLENGNGSESMGSKNNDSTALTNQFEDCTIVTFSMDRKMLFTNLYDEKSQTQIIHGLGGFVYAMDVSTLSSNFVCIAVGDKTIRVWDRSSKNDYCRSSVHWVGLQSDIVTLCWHPTTEGWIGYGTLDGRVGLFDVEKEKNHTYECAYTQNSAVAHVGWRAFGDHDGTKGGTPDALFYSCTCNGEFFEFVPKGHRAEGRPLGQLLQTVIGGNMDGGKVTRFAWANQRASDSNHLLAAGYSDGAIRIFLTPKLPLWNLDSEQVQSLSVFTYNYHLQAITAMKWCPLEHRDSWLATGSEDRSARVVNVGPGGRDVSEVVVFRGHNKPVSDVSWHPTKEILATASHDKTANVWDIASHASVVNCRGHSERVTCVIWSSTNEGVLYSGSEDQSILSWDINTQSFEGPPTKACIYSSQKLHKAHLPTSSNAVPSLKPKENSGKSKKTKSAIPLFAAESEDTRAMLQQYREIRENPADDVSYSVENRLIRSCEVLLNKQILSHRTTGNYRAARVVESWRGEIWQTVNRMIKEKRLTSDWVALSMSGGEELWERAVMAYASQLEASGDIHMAANYYVSVSKVGAAVQMYMRHKLLKDALVLATAKLSPYDKNVSMMLFELGKMLERQGKNQLAYDAFVGSGNLQRAEAAMGRIDQRAKKENAEKGEDIVLENVRDNVVG
jgi:WD40 repeat protein